MLVSCIMPTFNRREFIPLALKCFLSQDWPEKELIVIDDGTDAVADLFIGLESVRYSWAPTRRSIGEKLNVACNFASGDILVRFDDDDWSAPNRISDQVNRLLGSAKDVTGYHSLLFWEPSTNSGSKYKGESTYALGTSHCFRRSYWKRFPFKACSTGEDNNFIQQAKREKSIISVDGDQMMVARVHPNSTSKRTPPLPWGGADRSMFPSQFFEDLATS